MKILGFTIIRTVELNSQQTQIDVLKKLNESQTDVIRKLRLKVDKEKLVDLIKVDIGDPTPTDIEPRKAYIGRVAGFYKDILEQKCLQMVSVFHRLLEEETNDRETDNILKNGIFICREWMRWGNQAVNEAISYQVEKPQTDIEQKETEQINIQL